VSELFVVGISWRTAQVAVREKLAFREEEVPQTLRALLATNPVAEALLVSTCNRVEVYGVAKPGQDATGHVRRFLAEQRGLDAADVADVLYDYRGSDAVRHVFRVASALDSLVIGEAQILGSRLLRRRRAEYASPCWACLERAFGVAKRVRTETTTRAVLRPVGRPRWRRVCS
jgi:glutamyl-tRNA reductase